MKGLDRNNLGLDALSFFIADVQTGFGPFIAVYLANSGWSEGDIGFALSVGTVTAMVSQLPGGALVDRLRDKRVAAAAACLVVAVAALLFAFSTTRASVLGAETAHSFGSAMLGPAVAAVSLMVVGRSGLGARLGRNARFAAIGNAAAAALLGGAGTYLAPRAVFWLTAGFMVPGLIALAVIRRPPDMPDGDAKADTSLRGLLRDALALLGDRRVLGFAAAIALFHLANAALLPLAASELAHRIGQHANAVISWSVVVPQAIVALISPLVGRTADSRGPRIVIALGFAAVPARALLLAVASHPVAIVAVQALDGFSAATFGVMVPLVAAELTRGTPRFNLCLGTFGLATSAGATISTSLAGAVAERGGESAAFLTLAAFGAAAAAVAFLTAPRRTGGEEPPRGDPA